MLPIKSSSSACKDKNQFANMESSILQNTEKTIMDQTGGFGALVVSVIRHSAEKHGGTLYLEPMNTLVDHISLPHNTVDICRQEIRSLLTELELLLALRSRNPESYLSSS